MARSSRRNSCSARSSLSMMGARVVRLAEGLAAVPLPLARLLKVRLRAFTIGLVVAKERSRATTRHAPPHYSRPVDLSIGGRVPHEEPRDTQRALARVSPTVQVREMGQERADLLLGGSRPSLSPLMEEAGAGKLRREGELLPGCGVITVGPWWPRRARTRGWSPRPS